MTLTLTDLWTLALTTAIIAGALVLEHVYTGNRGWPARFYYAEGLITVLIGLLAWAALRRITITPLNGLLILIAAALSGAPDFLILWHEDRKRAQHERDRAAAWTALEATNAELAAQLAVLLSKPTNNNYMRRLREMIETAAFTTHAIRQERQLIELAETQADTLLQQIRDIVGDPSRLP